jgi:hypothetical protein
MMFAMLQPLAFTPLPLGSVRPTGWLRNQLRIQAEGISGKLDEFWPDVMRSGWIGGDAEGWERGPYWLDGIVPLAFLLDDDRLKEKVRRWMDYILTHQRDDGWLGPVKGAEQYKDYDPWPVFVALKAMTQYHEATRDERVPPAIRRFLDRLDKLLDERALFHWGRFRWADGVITVQWLYDRAPDPELIRIARKVVSQGYDWGRAYADIPWKQKLTKEEFERFKAEANGDWGNDRFMSSHGVNVAMGLKAPAVMWRITGDARDRGAARRMLEQLDEFHGQVNGTFTCDEHLAGLNPSQGTELCTVVEMMYSLELLLGITGEAHWADRLELVTFNALPATFSPDMWTHQYDQQANQVVCKVSPERVYVNNGPEANLFGVEPNYGCCTANLSQGWPKFASHLWMKSPDEGLVATSRAPCEVRAQLAGADVTVHVETDYPFDEQVSMRVTTSREVEFPLRLHVPAWASGATVCVDGETSVPAQPGTFHEIRRRWSGTTTLNLTLPMSPRRVARPENRAAISRGPLVYALRIGEDWRVLRGQPPRADYEVHPTTPWNYAIDPASVKFTTKPVGSRPFCPDGAPVRATVAGKRIDAWQLERNAAAQPPDSPVDSSNPLEQLTLIPYGSTNLRVTEFPVLK